MPLDASVAPSAWARGLLKLKMRGDWAACRGTAGVGGTGGSAASAGAAAGGGASAGRGASAGGEGTLEVMEGTAEEEEVVALEEEVAAACAGATVLRFRGARSEETSRRCASRHGRRPLKESRLNSDRLGLLLLLRRRQRLPLRLRRRWLGLRLRLRLQLRLRLRRL